MHIIIIVLVGVVLENIPAFVSVVVPPSNSPVDTIFLTTPSFGVILVLTDRCAIPRWRYENCIQFVAYFFAFFPFSGDIHCPKSGRAFCGPVPVVFGILVLEIFYEGDILNKFMTGDVESIAASIQGNGC